MSRDKQIEEMAEIIANNTEMDTMWNEIYDSANALYNAGYRKIYDDHQRQCTCYALGCQMAEQLEKKVAEEIFADLDKALGELAMKYSDEGLNDYFGVCEVILTKVIYPIKKKYTVTSTNIATPID